MSEELKQYDTNQPAGEVVDVSEQAPGEFTNVTLSDVCKEPLTEDFIKGLGKGIAVMRHPISEFNALVAKYPYLNYTETKVGQEWAKAIQDATAMLNSGDAFGSRVEDPMSDWRQGVDVGGKLLRAGRPALGMGDLLS